ncbi:NAD(P)H-dependent oxidoreductase [Oricola sp.]|uniref:NAD(P)H-dependent oxidoreductase n=1 Tax=Oricola sp. TaxID=1979950 RepID=UPI003BAAEA28
MKVLVVYCHPLAGSFTEAVRDALLEALAAGGAEIEVIDLYGEGFDPVLSAEELQNYIEPAVNTRLVERHVAALSAADALAFVYPTWWYGQPAMLKGWLDRVLLPEVAFHMPKADGEDIRPALTRIRTVAVFTTCGASRWLTWLVGAPGRRTLLRGVRTLCHRWARTVSVAHYSMDSSTDASRARHLEKVRRAAEKLAKTAR